MSFLDSIRHKLSKLVPTPQKEKEEEQIDNSTPSVLYMCNGCMKSFKRDEPRYQCSECQSLDLCRDCYIKDLQFYSHLATQRENEKKGLKSPKNTSPPPNFTLSYAHPDSAPLPHMFTIETKSQLGMAYTNKGQTEYESMRNSFREHRDRQCIGTRKKVPVSEQYPNGLGEFEWLTYKQFQTKTKYFHRALSQFIPTRTFVSICANNCLEWYITDISCLWGGMPVVAIHHQANSEALLEILSNSQSGCIIIENEIVDKIVDLIVEKKYLDLKLIVVIVKEGQQLCSRVKEIPNTTLVKTFDEMMELGVKSKKVKHSPITKDEIITLVYTSGSTGVPKGVITKDIEWNRQVTESFVAYPACALSFLTLSHSQRRFDHKLLFHGAKIGIFSGSMDTLFDDIQKLRPTIFWGVPRIWNLIYSQYQNELVKVVKENPNSSREFCEELAMLTFKNILGDRVTSIVTGGAPTSQEVFEFMKRCWSKSNVNNSYGLSEAIGIFVDGYIAENIQFKIEPCPEFGYYPTDIPNPRGELWVKTDTMSTGYYRNEKQTLDSYQDGWFKTGDIVEQIGYRKVKIIDRKKNAFKLSNGEFVAPEPLENVFLGSSELISQIFIYGDTMKTFLVAVIIPKRQVLIEYGINDIRISKEDITDNAELKKKLYQDILNIAKEKNLANYEIPKAIEIDTTKWTTENELITGSGKYCRGKLCVYYKEKIDQLYGTINSIQSGLRNQDDQKHESILSYVKSVLNIDTSSLDGQDLSKLSFTQIGGDSLGAIKLSSILREKANIQLSPADILNNKNNLDNIFNKKQVDKEYYNWRAEMTLGREDTITTKDKTIGRVLESGNNVFLTGATGYLGSHLLYQLLENGKHINKIYCLMRGTGELKQKLLDQFAVKYQLVITPEMNANERVEIVPGDLSLERFGLDETEFSKLASNIHFIIHNGASVNMVLPYTNMKPINVDGSVEILKLACVGTVVKPISFVSTIGVFVRDREITELSIPSNDYLSFQIGYNQSKLVAENLMRQASQRGVPIIFFRPATIYAHSKNGTDNEHDLVRMVIRGLLYMGVYPSQDTIPSSGGAGYFNLSNVDWVSHSITKLSLDAKSWILNKDESNVDVLPIFHMVNEEPVLLERLCELIDKNQVKEMKKVSYSEWLSILKSDPKNPIYELITVQFPNSFPGMGKAPLKNPRTTTHLQSLGFDKCPPISEETIVANAKHLIQTLNNGHQE